MKDFFKFILRGLIALLIIAVVGAAAWGGFYIGRKQAKIETADLIAKVSQTYEEAFWHWRKFAIVYDGHGEDSTLKHMYLMSVNGTRCYHLDSCKCFHMDRPATYKEELEAIRKAIKQYESEYSNLLETPLPKEAREQIEISEKKKK